MHQAPDYQNFSLQICVHSVPLHWKRFHVFEALLDLYFLYSHPRQSWGVRTWRFGGLFGDWVLSAHFFAFIRVCQVLAVLSERGSRLRTQRTQEATYVPYQMVNKIFYDNPLHLAMVDTFGSGAMEITYNKKESSTDRTVSASYYATVLTKAPVIHGSHAKDLSALCQHAFFTLINRQQKWMIRSSQLSIARTKPVVKRWSIDAVIRFHNLASVSSHCLFPLSLHTEPSG